MNNQKDSKFKDRKRPSSHVTHTVGVEVGLSAVEEGMKRTAKYIASRPYKTFPGTNLIRPQPFKWGVTRYLGRGGPLGFKLMGKIPIVGPLIDLFTPSNTIMSGSEEMRLLRRARARQQAVHKPIEIRSITYPDGTTHFPKQNKWVFPPTEVTLSKKISRPFKKSWSIPRGQTEPFPRNIAKIPMHDRQPFLRDYYRANPIAAQQARSQARKIIKWANKHLR